MSTAVGQAVGRIPLEKEPRGRIRFYLFVEGEIWNLSSMTPMAPVNSLL